MRKTYWKHDLAIDLTAPDVSRTDLDTSITFGNNRLLIDLCGALDSNLTKIETAIAVQINRRGNVLVISGDSDSRKHAEATLRALYGRLEDGRDMEPADVDAAIRMPAEIFEEPLTGDQIEMFSGDRLEIRTRKKVVEPRTKAQNNYVRALFDHELVFGLGPAGTGKTYLAMAVAVAHFLEGRVDKIILSRPAVEAGERLGFLPGDLKEKVDPYMQPLYDALNDFLPAKQVTKLIEDKHIEIAPLAFMRGRTLSRAFIILDEAQNATTMQMKMFLTRLGEGSRMAITGDTSQIDLPRGVKSGLVEASEILAGIEGIGFTTFTAVDVIRHPMVAKVVRAYEAAAKK
ncbi:MAG: PhoH family protein [Rhodobacteraceae bacterium]|nr:PhoH family protein [Paracoccaceae bacterium]